MAQCLCTAKSLLEGGEMDDKRVWLIGKTEDFVILGIMWYTRYVPAIGTCRKWRGKELVT